MIRTKLCALDSADRDAAIRVLTMAFEQVIRYLHISDATDVWVVCKNREIVGVAALNAHADLPWLILEGIAVLPGNPGAAMRLMRRVHGVARQKYQQVITYAMSWNGRSIALLLKCGYLISDHQWNGPECVHFYKVLK